jgi:hypothetical protein
MFFCGVVVVICWWERGFWMVGFWASNFSLFLDLFLAA